MKLLRSLYINRLFFYILGGVGGLFFISFFAKWLFSVSIVLLLLLLLITVIDIFILYSGKKMIEANRHLPDRLSNGDDNIISIRVTNNFPFSIDPELVDEIPFQFQKRDFSHRIKIKALVRTI